MCDSTPNSVRWLPMPGYEDAYFVSERGEVKRVLRGQGARLRVLKPSSNGHGYLKITVSHQNLTKQFYIHRAVAAAFLGVCPDGMHVNHKDGNKQNNHVSNLEYVTPLDNTRHAVSAGLFNHGGAANGNAKLSPEDVKTIRELDGVIPRREIAERFGIKCNTICQIVSGKRWRDRVSLPDVREV